jgi:hypothetical protein
MKTTRESHILCPRKVQACCILNSAKPAFEEVGFYFENPKILVVSGCLYPIGCCAVLTWCVLLQTKTTCKAVKVSIRKKSLTEPATDPLSKYSTLRACVYHSVFRNYKHRSEVYRLALHLFISCVVVVL